MTSDQTIENKITSCVLEAKADVDRPDNEGFTPLMSSCQTGHDLCARALLEAKADLEKQTAKGFTALMLSAQNGHDLCARALLEAKADLEKQTAQGSTALILSCQNGHDLCARALLDVSCPPRTPLRAPRLALSLGAYVFKAVHVPPCGVEGAVRCKGQGVCLWARPTGQHEPRHCGFRLDVVFWPMG